MTEIPASRDSSRVAVWLAAAAVLIGVVTVVALKFNRDQVLPAGKAATTRPASRPTADLGTVESVVFCEAAGRTPQGLFDMRGVFNELSFDRFPAKASFALVFTVRPGTAPHKYTFTFTHPSGLMIEQEFPVPPGPAAMTDVIRAPDMPIERPGALVFRVFADGQQIGGRVVPVYGPASAAVTRPSEGR